MSPVAQDKKGAALAIQAYRIRTHGRDLEADIKAGGHEADIAGALNQVWPSMPGGSQQNTTMPQFIRRLHDAQAAEGPQQQVTQAVRPPGERGRRRWCCASSTAAADTDDQGVSRPED